MIDELFSEMQSKGIVSFESTWIQRATEQKNPRLTVFLACSKQLPLIQDELSKVMALILPNETSIINWN